MQATITTSRVDGKWSCTIAVSRMHNPYTPIPLFDTPDLALAYGAMWVAMTNGAALLDEALFSGDEWAGILDMLDRGIA
ncbi:MAG: hypothetical protein EOQ93_29360 [Mesorhizobium sp.]|nr:MAG: hypothetical protein EOQ93_29360 [Mesorhizobium sp.]